MNKRGKEEMCGAKTGMEKKKSYQSGRSEIRTAHRAIRVSPQTAASWWCSQAPHASPQFSPTVAVPTKTSPPSHALRAHGVIPGSFGSVSSSADALATLLRCACCCCCCCCWTECARRGLPRNTDETRGRAESSRQLSVKQRF